MRERASLSEAASMTLMWLDDGALTDVPVVGAEAATTAVVGMSFLFSLDVGVHAMLNARIHDETMGCEPCPLFTADVPERPTTPRVGCPRQRGDRIQVASLVRVRSQNRSP